MLPRTVIEMEAVRDTSRVIGCVPLDGSLSAGEGRSTDGFTRDLGIRSSDAPNLRAMAENRYGTVEFLPTPRSHSALYPLRHDLRLRLISAGGPSLFGHGRRETEATDGSSASAAE